MYETYKNLVSQKSSQSDLIKFVEKADTNELCNMVLKVLNTTEAFKMIDKLLLCFAELSDNKSHDKRYSLVMAVFDALRTAKVTSKHVDNIKERIVCDFCRCKREHLVKLVEYFIKRIENNDDEFMCWKDVLPLLLERLEEEKTVNHNGSELNGKDYKIAIIHKIVDINWDTKVLTSLAKMFIELIAEMKPNICEKVIRALTYKIMSVELSEMPPLSHQMLKLGSENNSVLLFSTLSKYFSVNYESAIEESNSQEDSESIVSGKVSLKEIQETESTVLYYIYQSVLDNDKGCTDYMRSLKSVINAPEYILDPFVISVLLLLSNLYKEQALQILKSAFLRHIQEHEYESQSAWLRGITTDNLNVIDVINQVINNSNKDRQLVLKGMVDFAFVLLSIDRKAGTDLYVLWDYGCKILQKIAKKRNDAGGTILEILIDKIIRGGINVIQYTDCLGFMCRKLTSTVLEQQVKISQLMEQLLVIPGSSAAQVLQAILPLMRISGSIRDSLIIILRKALYRKGTETRRMAVLGFLQLLKNLKLSTLTALSQSDSLSSSNVASSASILTQATLERHRASSNPWHNTSLCREILAILSKCFTHEIEVRTHLYQELYYGIVKNEELTEYVVEMLLEHFSKYYEKDQEVLPPVIFERCCACQGIEVLTEEPIADLIFALQKMYLRVASKDSGHIDKLSIILESLCVRMAQTDLEHMGLDDEIDLMDGLPKSQTKILNLKQAILVYEALLAFRIGSWSTISFVGQNVLSLFKGYQRFVDFLRRLGKTKKGPGKGKKDKDDTTMVGPAKKGRSALIKMPNTIMDFDTIAKSIVLLYDPSSSYTTEEQSNYIRGRTEFQTYILQTCVQLFQNIKTLKDNELNHYLELNKHNFSKIGTTLYKFVVCDLKKVIELNEQVDELGFECFKECCEVMCTLYSKELPMFLQSICNTDSSQGLNFQVQSLISSLKDVFLQTFDVEETGELKFKKVAEYLIDTIAKFTQKITFGNLKADKAFDWLIEFSKSKENVEMPIASIVVNLILMTEERSLEHSVFIQKLCDEYCRLLGTTNKAEVTTTQHFNMINEDNVHMAYIATNKILTTKLQNLNWLLGRLNAEFTAMTTFEVNSEYDKKKIKEREQSLCCQFAYILGVFETLTRPKINPGQASDVLFKNLQKVYNFACTLAKYFRKKSTASNVAFQSVKFIPVVQGAGTALKQVVGDMILHIEASQSGGKSNDANVQRNKILKEVMVIPGVVQAIDMFDKEIALLSKKTKVDLMKYTKYNTVRDFRIANSQLMESLEKMNVSLVITQTRNVNDEAEEEDGQEEEEMEVEEEEEDNDSDESPPKKRRS